MARPREPVRTTVSLQSVVETALSFLTEKLRRRQIEVRNSFDEECGISGDPEKLRAFADMVPAIKPRAEQMRAALYQNHPYGISVEGTLSSVQDRLNPRAITVRTHDPEWWDREVYYRRVLMKNRSSNTVTSATRYSFLRRLALIGACSSARTASLTRA